MSAYHFKYFQNIEFKNHGIAPTPPDLPTLKAYPTPGVGGRFGIFSLKWRERMNLKVPGATLPLGCAILSTRVRTVRGGWYNAPLGELGLTRLRPFTKLIDPNFDFGSFWVTGVKSSFSLKMLLLEQYTLYGHVTYARKQAWDPLQNLLTQISIWGHLGSQGSKRSFSLKTLLLLHITYHNVMWFMCMIHLETCYKSNYFKFWSKVIWGHRGQKVISSKNDITRIFYIAWL